MDGWMDIKIYEKNMDGWKAKKYKKNGKKYMMDGWMDGWMEKNMKKIWMVGWIKKIKK